VGLILLGSFDPPFPTFYQKIDHLTPSEEALSTLSAKASGKEVAAYDHGTFAPFEPISQGLQWRESYSSERSTSSIAFHIFIT